MGWVSTALKNLDFDVVANPGALHQNEAGRVLMSGFAKHGINARLIGRNAEARAPFVATWGWRNAEPHVEGGRNVLVMERAYIGDRFRWYSLGWNGLNGRALFPKQNDPSRWDRYFGDETLKPWHSGKYALVLGQVTGDAAVRGVNFRQWADDSIEALRSMGWPVRWRPHPQAPNDCVACEPIGGTLDEALAGAGLAVTYNSNSGVDAVLAGTPTVVCDRGGMAFDIAANHVEDDPVKTDRRPWAHRLAWCQWLPGEIESGEAWEHLGALMI